MENKTDDGASLLNDGLGWCPCCGTNTPTLPPPAEGTCAICCNHQMHAQEQEQEMVTVTREMAMDAGDPSMEGMRIKW